uniref:Minor structural protein n=1 Tax=Dulem virus 33 TaxID=3145751 RepID=A0AAU8B7Z9_9CAUD
MALTRKSLKAMGLTDEQVDSIIEMHTETVDGLKADVERYKADAKALPGVQKQLEQAQADLEAGKKDSYKVKYEAIKEEFEGYKNEQTKKESRAAKEKAYRELLKAAGISEKRIDAVLRVSDVDSVELDDKGAIKGAEELTKSVKSEWSDFVVTTATKGADTPKPPANTGGSMTKDQIMAIKDRSERRAAIAANINLFQKGE